MSDEVRFFTQANSRFFLAAVAMLESLRISGNTAPAFVLDDGLRPDERERLAAGGGGARTARRAWASSTHGR